MVCWVVTPSLGYKDGHWRRPGTGHNGQAVEGGGSRNGTMAASQGVDRLGALQAHIAVSKC